MLAHYAILASLLALSSATSSLGILESFAPSAFTDDMPDHIELSELLLQMFDHFPCVLMTPNASSYENPDAWEDCISLCDSEGATTAKEQLGCLFKEEIFSSGLVRTDGFIDFEPEITMTLEGFDHGLTTCASNCIKNPDCIYWQFGFQVDADFDSFTGFKCANAELSDFEGTRGVGFYKMDNPPLKQSMCNGEYTSHFFDASKLLASYNFQVPVPDVMEYAVKSRVGAFRDHRIITDHCDLIYPKVQPTINPGSTTSACVTTKPCRTPGCKNCGVVVDIHVEV